MSTVDQCNPILIEDVPQCAILDRLHRKNGSAEGTLASLARIRRTSSDLSLDKFRGESWPLSNRWPSVEDVDNPVNINQPQSCLI